MFGVFFCMDAQAAANPNFITSVDVMKFTKDRVANQPSNAQIKTIVATIVDNIHPDYLAISVPIDPTTDYSNKPAPRTAEEFTRAWTDAIHAEGKNVIFRGTWSSIEGIYNFPKLVGNARFPAGDASSAMTDGDSTWLGKTYNYILDNPGLFSDGDIWAVLPERTEGIFRDETSFLGYDGLDIQTNYVKFFSDLNKVSAQAFAQIGKNVRVGMTANNFSEVGSGWLVPTTYDTSGMIVIDHYGITHTPLEMENNLRAAFNKYHKPIFLQEWGDYWNRTRDEADRKVYLSEMYGVFAKLAQEKILVGFNYWGGWTNDAEGILVETQSGYAVNSRGQMLAEFFAQVNPRSSAIVVTKPVSAKTEQATNDNTIQVLVPHPQIMDAVVVATPEDNNPIDQRSLALRVLDWVTGTMMVFVSHLRS